MFRLVCIHFRQQLFRIGQLGRSIFIVRFDLQSSLEIGNPFRIFLFADVVIARSQQPGKFGIQHCFVGIGLREELFSIGQFVSSHLVSCFDLKSIHSVADGVFLADNQRYVRKDASLAMNLQRINQQIVEPFYDLMCAGEVTNVRHVGAKTMDAGDIMQSIDGWTAIGVGKTDIPRGFRFPWEMAKTSFREKSGETLRAMQAMDAAVSELSVALNPEDAGRALYLLAAPTKEMSMDIAKGLGDYLRELAENAVIRAGDFPRDRGSVNVTILFSQLAFVQKIRDYYDRASAFAMTQKDRLKETTGRLRDMEDAAKGLPSLI